MDFIWVCIHGGVMGFEPEEIVEFERTYRQLANIMTTDYWSCFNWYFEETLSGREALCFSTLWTKPATWKKLAALR